ncbi:MAG: DUF1634 domain-containing protein [Candidatus Acidiferrales bacterium]|jgi:uncharacterized membrane protein
MTNAHGMSEERFEGLIGNLLRAGVILAAAVVLTGGVLYLAKYGAQRPQYQAFRGEPSDLRQVSQIFREAVSLHSRGLIQLGLLILIATPVARVAFSVLAFAEQRDWLYVSITLIVLAVLVYSLVNS